MLSLFLLGAAAGALTGVPIGPVNVAVIDAAYRHTMRRALAVGLGGAIADTLYSALGILGVAPLLREHPSIPPLLYLVSGVVLLGYGFLTVRSQPVPMARPSAAGARAPAPASRHRELWSGLRLGLALILMNPAAAVTWVLIMGQIIPDATVRGGVAWCIGVAIGSFAWFAIVAYATQKGKSVLGDKAAWIPRAVGVALMGYSMYLLTRAVQYFVA